MVTSDIPATFFQSCMYRSFVLLLFARFFVLSAFSQSAPPTLDIKPLSGDFYVYSTYSTYEGNRIPAHGMYLVTPEGVVLFDTPWDTTQFQPLLDSIQHRHGRKVRICIATHWHSDRTEGLEYYRAQGIATYTTALTDAWSQRNNKKRAEFLMTKDTVFQVGGHRFEVYYPGEGHTADNIVIWFAREKILYGGCLIKGAEAENLGYMGDANKTEYLHTLEKVKKKCPAPRYIIVSHHDWTNSRSLDHSIKLARALRDAQQ